MPFTSVLKEILSNGTRTAVIEHTTHIRGGFSGPARPSDTYYSVEGRDSLTPRIVALPPGFETFDEARAWAVAYVGNPPLPSFKHMTPDGAKNLRHGVVLEHRTRLNADGTPMRCRVNGKCKTWKTRSDFSLPVKYGMYQCFYIGGTPADQPKNHDATSLTDHRNWKVAR